MDVEQIRLEIEDAGRRHLAASTSGDAEALDQLLAEELFYTHSNGKTDASKADYIGNFVANRHYVATGMSVEHSVERIIVLNDDLAIIKGKQITNTVGEIGAKWEDVEATSTDTWVRRDGRWQLIAHQSTLVLEGDNYRKAFVAGHPPRET
jgi:uncharacterized protein (TIGR02246 family)